MNRDAIFLATAACKYYFELYLFGLKIIERNSIFTRKKKNEVTEQKRKKSNSINFHLKNKNVHTDVI